MKKLIFTFWALCGAFGLTMTFAGKIVSGRQQDKFQYNVVYACAADSSRNFKVLSCNGSGVCKVFIFNEYNPNGGFESEMSKALITETISRYKCAAPGGNKNAEPQNEQAEETKKNAEPPQNQQNQPNETNGAVACPASDPDSDGKTAMEKSFRGAIRETWEKEPEPGMDGRVTVTFQSFRVGAAHKYRVYLDPKDAVGKMIYAVRATFTTCTDYNRRIENVKREREFSCYKNTADKNACTIIAAANTNVKDKTESIDKPMR